MDETLVLPLYTRSVTSHMSEWGAVRVNTSNPNQLQVYE